jgi:hypothetical protein
MNNYALVRWRMGHLDSALDIFNQLLTLYAVLDDAAQRLPEEGDDENEALGGEGEFPHVIFHNNIFPCVLIKPISYVLSKPIKSSDYAVVSSSLPHLNQALCHDD